MTTRVDWKDGVHVALMDAARSLSVRLTDEEAYFLVRVLHDQGWRFNKIAQSITCPRCGMTSYNGNDVQYKYCGNCHDFTGYDQ